MLIILLLLGQNVCEVNRKRFRLAAASSMCDSTKHNGLVTKGLTELCLFMNVPIYNTTWMFWRIFLPLKPY